jgi:hypothetical protein
MYLYMQKVLRNPLELASEFSKVARYETNVKINCELVQWLRRSQACPEHEGPRVQTQVPPKVNCISIHYNK